LEPATNFRIALSAPAQPQAQPTNHIPDVGTVIEAGHRLSATFNLRPGSRCGDAGNRFNFNSWAESASKISYTLCRSFFCRLGPLAKASPGGRSSVDCAALGKLVMSSGVCQEASVKHENAIGRLMLKSLCAMQITVR